MISNTRGRTNLNQSPTERPQVSDTAKITKRIKLLAVVAGQRVTN